MVLLGCWQLSLRHRLLQGIIMFGIVRWLCALTSGQWSQLNACCGLRPHCVQQHKNGAWAIPMATVGPVVCASFHQGGKVGCMWTVLHHHTVPVFCILSM